MIFIAKTKPPRQLLKFIASEKSAKIHPSYKNLRTPFVEDLDKLLFKEQKGICCYCMQEIPEISSKRTREHFLPESKFKLDELNYYNLFLACTEKSGTNTGHCDKTKGDILISKYIGHPDCEEFFKYNSKGEILPKRLGFEEWSKFKNSTNSNELFEKSPETAEIIASIAILNLNEKELITKRKEFIEGLNQYVLPKLNSKADCLKEIEKYQNFTHNNPKPFAGVAIYFLKERLKSLTP